jgi:pectinesterase
MLFKERMPFMSPKIRIVNLVYATLFYLAALGVCFPQADKADFVVASDGSGDYAKVQDAVKAAGSGGKVIYIKAGTYNEQIRMSSAHKGLRLVGESREKVLITFGDDGDASGTRGNHATIIVTAEDFYAENITIEQTFDSREGKRQAEALSVRADRAVFYKCGISGFQDTYRIKGMYRAYHKDCIIDGTTDFIYGNGIGLFEDCVILNRSSSHITAHNQTTKDKAKHGLVFINCAIKVHPDEKGVTAADLGRPWGNGAKTVFFKCDLGAHIKPEGWSIWRSKPNNHKTCFYAEYKNFGPGARSG